MKTRRRARLLVYGDIEMDVILKTSAGSPMEEDSKVEEAAFLPGGSAANCAAIASNLGLKASFLGTVSSDPMSRLLVEDLRRFKVNTRHMQVVDGPSAVVVGIVDGQGNRKLYSYRGVNKLFPVRSIPENLLRQHGCLHLSGYSFQEAEMHPVAVQLISKAKEHGSLVSFDPSFFFTRHLDLQKNDILKGVDFFYPNREEAYQLTGKRDALEAVRMIRANGPKTVIITLDREGCLVSGEGVEAVIPPVWRVDAVDTTGAGDAFCAGFLFALLNGLGPVEACKTGSAAAAHLITKLGGHENAPRLADILLILRQNSEDELANILEVL